MQWQYPSSEIYPWLCVVNKKSKTRYTPLSGMDKIIHQGVSYVHKNKFAALQCPEEDSQSVSTRVQRGTDLSGQHSDRREGSSRLITGPGSREEGCIQTGTHADPGPRDMPAIREDVQNPSPTSASPRKARRAASPQHGREL